jgi:DNA repair protein RecN (Recombination protein N)
MLRTLRVQDLAIIEELELLLEPGLNAVTGETGAGKSILLQALDVALGGRPDADLVRTGAEEAVVEALFTEVPARVHDLLAAGGIPLGDELVLRRVITRGGRSRAYVNAQMGSLALLRDLAPHLLCVYGQDEHQALRRVESHRELLDAVGGLGSAVGEMAHRHGRLARAREAVARARAAEEEGRRRAETLRAEAEELARAGLVAGEEETLVAERRRLTHAERLASLAASAEAGLYSGEGAAVEAVGRARAALREAEQLDPGLESIRALVETALAELEEAGSMLGRYGAQTQLDPERLDVVERRLAELARLRRKYDGSVDDLVRRRDEMAATISQASASDGAPAAQEAEVEAAQGAATEWARRLSVERRRVAHELTRALAGELKALALDGARFEVRFGEVEERSPGPAGWDEIEFFLSANAGEDPRSLARVASGGELSRIMLAVKALAAGEERGATLIFDEVDAGIGGAVAEVVGRKLQQLGRTRQVLCITHLPLIAAFADHHVMVAKRVVAGRTVSSARPLSTSERVAELARMLGGARLTPEVQGHAEQLLRRARERGRGGRRALTGRAVVE